MAKQRSRAALHNPSAKLRNIRGHLLGAAVRRRFPA